MGTSRYEDCFQNKSGQKSSLRMILKCKSSEMNSCSGGFCFIQIINFRVSPSLDGNDEDERKGGVGKGKKDNQLSVCAAL